MLYRGSFPAPLAIVVHDGSGVGDAGFIRRLIEREEFSSQRVRSQEGADGLDLHKNAIQWGALAPIVVVLVYRQCLLLKNMF